MLTVGTVISSSLFWFRTRFPQIIYL